jgi:Holliday junction DNA helicase RuvA
MIGYLEGTIRELTEKHCIVLASGVGYKVYCPLPALLNKKVGENAALHIHTHVREDTITLYGFPVEAELFIFEKLIDVSGIGPKSALAMLSVHSPATIATAIEGSNTDLLSHTPGIGKRTVEKLIIELKGKLGHLVTGGENEHTLEVRMALEALGYSPKEIHDVVSKLDTKETNSQMLIKQALGYLQ